MSDFQKLLRGRPVPTRYARGKPALRGRSATVIPFRARRKKPGRIVWLMACLSAAGFFALPDILDGSLVASASALVERRQSLAPVISGTASVIDGDTLEIHGKRIRLHAIDAPESRQTCNRGGEVWRCGQASALALSDKIGRRSVSCEQTDIDRYQRIVARCFAGGEDLNGWLVGQGLAVAYRQYGRDYVAAEGEAKAARRGMWAGEFVIPWEWRRGVR